MSGKAFHRVIASKIWYFFNSLKLTLGVLLTLAVVSILGTVVEQNKTAGEYVALYGERWANFIMALRIHDLFHSWWFISMLGLLALNIIVCTFERFPPKWKSLLDHKPDKFDAKLIDRFSNKESFTMDQGAASVKERVLKAFKKKRFDIVEVPSATAGEHHFYAWKGRIGRLGSDVTHISLLLILLGAIVGSFAGYKDFDAVFVGNEMSVKNEDFKLRLDRFWIDYYDSGQIRQYNSILTVVEDGKDVLTKQIWVNEPLYYKGVRFYQSSFGAGWNRVAEAQIQVKNKDNVLEEPITVNWKAAEPMPIPNTKYSVRLIGYSSDFAFDERSNTVFSKSAEANNPAVNLEVYEGDKIVSTPWLFLNYPGIFPAIPGADEDLVFVGYRDVMYSGLSINKDPGTNIVWAGTIVMGIGFLLAFFVYHRRIWIVVKETGNSSEVKFGGMINKNQFAFEKDFKEVTDLIKSE